MAEISAEWHWEGVEWLGGGEKTGLRDLAEDDKEPPVLATWLMMCRRKLIVCITDPAPKKCNTTPTHSAKSAEWMGHSVSKLLGRINNPIQISAAAPYFSLSRTRIWAAS